MHFDLDIVAEGHMIQLRTASEVQIHRCEVMRKRFLAGKPVTVIFMSCKPQVVDR
jgi:hypothetical protein